MVSYLYPFRVQVIIVKVDDVKSTTYLAPYVSLVGFYETDKIRITIFSDRTLAQENKFCKTIKNHKSFAAPRGIVQKTSCFIIIVADKIRFCMKIRTTSLEAG